MKTSISRKGAPGYVSVVLVLSTGLLLTMIMVFAYRGALASQEVQAKVQLRTDYAEKEEEILRAVVAITPNKAIRAMQNGSNGSAAMRNPLRWRNIFSEALTLANSRTSISAGVLGTLGVNNAIIANTGDGASLSLTDVKDLVDDLHSSTNPDHFVSPGLNRDLGAGFPPALDSAVPLVNDRDLLYPIISRSKIHGTFANGRVGLPVATYPQYNLLEYPQIGFGYARPGDPFVAKRNWWSFSLNAGNREDNVTEAVTKRRDFTLSIYEIPSQLAISAESFMSLGHHASGSAWQNTNIQGGVFAGRAVVEADTGLESISSRRGMEVADTAIIGGQSFAGSPFAPGLREAYFLTEGDFFPVSRASESGRAAFIPISRGALFFDRFATDENGVRLSGEQNMLSDTGWNHYSMGALQATMQLDVTEVQSATNPMPTKLRFSYLLPDGSTRNQMNVAVSGTLAGLPAGFVKVANENQSYAIPAGQVVDLAYGAPNGSGNFAFRTDISGTVTFNNATFGDPNVGTLKAGFWRPRAPFRIKQTSDGKICIALYPERFSAFLTKINAGGPAINHSVVVNVDYNTNLGAIYPTEPQIPTTDLDYGVILEECADLTPFTKGFSLVTNLRLYIGDDFNIVEATPPAGYTPAGQFFPPCSLFAPEKRYGVDHDPFAVNLSGQVGSLAKGHKVNDGDADLTVVRPLESLGASNNEIDPTRIVVNLRPITHPAELPPITMMNWLVVLEEKRSEFHAP